MANITGTESADTLTGTAADDIIKGLGGNDRIIGSLAPDSIDGGAGNDVIDYSGLNGTITFKLNSTNDIKILKDTTNGTDIDEISNIETIIASLDRPKNSLEFVAVPDSTTIDIDLSANRLTYFDKFTGITKTLTIKNFTNIYGGNSGKDRLAGNDSDNSILFGDVIIGSKGNDILEGTTIDYSNLGNAVAISAAWNQAKSKYGYFIAATVTSNKGTFGTDKIGYSSKIIGAINKINTLDTSSSNNTASLDVNLANNSLNVTIPNTTLELKYEIVNFVDFIGGKNNDKIVGGNKNSKLTGGGGNDTIRGGSKNDRITGTDATAKGVGEIDTLTGGGGRDKFILGDKNGAYYVGNGNNDYATITDFDLFKDSISIGSLKNYSFALESTNTIDLYSGKDVNTRDLIAKIQIVGGISSANSNSRSVMGTNSTLNALVRKLDIGSGSGSESESVGESLSETRES